MLNKTILLSPLDWGLGHASRCVPLIHHLKKNNTLIIGVTPLNSEFFSHYFPELKTVDLPSYQIRYSKVFPLWFKLLLQWPKIKNVIRKENQLLPDIIHANSINVIISDNRFGLYSRQIESIFITHQLQVKAPFFESLINRMNHRFIHCFSRVWVPDFEDKQLRLSGNLSDSTNIRIPVTYINPQSALTLFNENIAEKKVDYLILLSGIEPHRTMLEKQIITAFHNTRHSVVLVRGIPDQLSLPNKNIHVIPFAFGFELRSLIVNAKTVICRSGYSTLMDVFLLGKKELILFPTPGQSEQEYLASYWKERFASVTGEVKNVKLN